MSYPPPPLNRQSLRLAVLALTCLDFGASVPFGMAEIFRQVDANTSGAEYVLSGLFGAAGLAALVALVRMDGFAAEVAFCSGALWSIVASYVAVDSQVANSVRLGFGLIFTGVSLGCFALWQRLRAAAAT